MFEIGNSLREARHRRRIEIVQAEQATKIRGKYLRALEEEQFELLPAETYVKGFLRTYAEYLGLDGQLYVDEYNSRFSAGEDWDRPRRSTSRREKRSRRLERNIVIAVVALIAIVTVVLVAGGWMSSDTHKTTPRTHHTVHRRAVAAPSAYLTIRAAHGASYVAVHKGGPAGTILFQGTILRGHTEPFEGKSFWLNVSSPENLVITVGGHVVHLPGLQPRVLTVTATGWHLG